MTVIATKSGTTVEPNAFLEATLGADGRSPRCDPSPHLRGPGRVHRRDHRSRSERRCDPPPRRLPRGLPQPARHRRALLGADLRRSRAGVAHRPRPRRPARVGDRDARRLPRAGPGRQPGRLAGARPRHAREGRPRQADVPDRRRDRELRRLGGAAHRREHRQARDRDRAGRPRAAGRAGVLRIGSRVRPDRPCRLRRRRPRCPRRCPRGGRAPGHPPRPWPTRSTSAPSSFAGRSRSRSPAQCSASTRSTSRTSRRPRS